MKKTKKSNIPKRGDGETFSFVGNNLVTLGQSTSFHFVLQALGSSMALGSCSRYIELCPPPFGYSSKHMESLWCLLCHRLMSITCFLSLFIYHALVQGEVLQPESAILHKSLDLHESAIPRVLSSSHSESMKFVPDDQGPPVFPRRHVEDLRVVSLTLLLYSYLSFEDLEAIARVMKLSSPATGINAS
jgi:hypothetical protein